MTTLKIISQFSPINQGGIIHVILRDYKMEIIYRAISVVSGS